VKIRDADSRMVKNKAVYVALGANRDGVREVLGLWSADNEGTKFWLSVMAARNADHFGYSPEDVNWGHVGTLNHYHARLREITNMEFGKGEHSEKQRKIVPRAVPV